MNEHESLEAVHTHTHTHTHNPKEKIKKFIIIIAILLITILCFNVGAYAAYALVATDVSYTRPGSTSTISVKAALDELYIQPLAKAVSVGDYVAYDAGNSQSYISPTGTGSSHGNGSGDHTFTSSSSIKWRVLGWDDETGGVMLISEAPIGNFTLKGAIGYLYAEQELNEICKIYGYGTGANTGKKFKYLTGDTVEGTAVGTITGSGARSINIDDINNICGVTPSKLLNDDYGKAPYTKTIYYPTKNQKSGYSTSATSRTDVYTAYTYTISDYLSSSTELYKMLFRDTSNTSDIAFWLASRSVNSLSGDSAFFVRFCGSGRVTAHSIGGGTKSKFNEHSNMKSIRPIVYLKSSLQTNGKNSSGAWNIIDK